jgi:hypothetical protein
MTARSDAAIIRAAMSILGRRTSPAKAAASKRNAAKAGRPVGSKDTKPRKRRTAK